jgi:hypothetical protein
VIICACDPGATGAIACLDMFSLFNLVDMPSPNDLADLLRTLKPDLFVLEKVNGIPGQSASAAFNFGHATGEVWGIVTALEIRRERVSPAVWKRAMMAPADKEASRQRASELMPASSHLWPLKKHHGRAEAAMLALYAQRTFTS